MLEVDQLLSWPEHQRRQPLYELQRRQPCRPCPRSAQALRSARDSRRDRYASRLSTGGWCRRAGVSSSRGQLVRRRCSARAHCAAPEDDAAAPLFQRLALVGAATHGSVRRQLRSQRRRLSRAPALNDAAWFACCGDARREPRRQRVRCGSAGRWLARAARRRGARTVSSATSTRRDAKNLPVATVSSRMPALRQSDDHRGHSGTAGDREDPHAPGSAGPGTASGNSPWPGPTSGLTLRNREHSGDPATRAAGAAWV